MRFTKMQGVGNDFVVISEEDLAGRSIPELALSLCARHTGVGADGLLVIAPGAGEIAFSFRMFNPDGTEDMCGNGLRCACLWALRRALVVSSPDKPFDVWTKEGIRACRLVTIEDGLGKATAEVDMGRPKFTPADIPCLARHRTERVLDYPLEIADKTYSIDCVNTGSTHTAIFADRPPSEETFLRHSPQIENHPFFPERTSVLWCWPAGERRDPSERPSVTRRFQVRIWERGAGETLGCGTGACAVVSLALAKGLVQNGELPISVESLGGVLDIRWPSSQSILMTGPCEAVFEGSV